MSVRVAVIGAGAAGLCALRHLSARPSLFTPVAYELSKEAGGTWVYTDDVGTDANGQPIHCSMYKNLRTNLPKETMAFLDYPFSRSLPSFLPHKDVKQYLTNYSEHFDLTQYIQFQTSVENVKPEQGTKESVKWHVTTRCHLTDPPTDTTSVFDAVIVCNGHYSVPIIPQIPGLADFKGQVTHSHDYRDPGDFSGKTVLCLGAASSGQDISLDLLQHTKKVYLCHRHDRLVTPLPAGLKQKPGILRILPESVELEGGEVVAVDTLLFCTGYHYTFPLSPECGVNVSADERVTPLWKHLFHTRFPSLSFIGIAKKIVPFPQFDCQVQLVVKVLAGDVKLPSQEEMEADEKADFDARLASGMPPRYAHTLGSKQWEYNNQLADIGGFAGVNPVVEKLYRHVHSCRANDLPNYKKREFELKGPDTFLELLDSAKA